MKPTLLVLAAGMGSRYGGLKQMDAFGPSGETIIDYSIYDAINAGFGKVVFIIRESFRADFENFFKGKFEDKIEIVYVAQDLHKLPDGYSVPEHREKPWGTGHAVWVAKDVINEPFAVINADDYYGQESYNTLVDFFNSLPEGEQNVYALIGYYLKNTLSDHGTVNRGVCSSDTDGNLTTIVECTKIKRDSDNIVRYPTADDYYKYLPEDALVSMNMFGFLPSYFDYCENSFKQFLDKEMNVPKSEFYIPTLLDQLINTNQIKVKVLSSIANWFGVTYQDDKPIVIEKLNKLIEAEVYPKKLW